MWGEKYLSAFLLGNILGSAAGKLFQVDTPFILAIIFILITISASLQFIKKEKSNYPLPLPHINLFLSLIIMILLGASNNSRVAKEEKISTISTYTPLIVHLKGIREIITKKFMAKSSRIIKNKNDFSTLLAFTIGNKGLLQKETKDAYKNSGAMHILALSGLHIGIIFGMVETLLFFLNFSFSSRQMKLIICSTAIFIYTAIGGFSASISRAAIMILLHKLLEICHRRKGKWSTWLCSADIILLVAPNSITDIGFQLSFAAVAGIIALYPTIRDSYKGPAPLRPVWDLASISVACQITTLPLVLHYFKASAMYFLITNLVAIPLVTLSIYTFTVAYITAEIPIINELTSLLAEISIRALNATIEFIGS